PYRGPGAGPLPDASPPGAPPSPSAQARGAPPGTPPGTPPAPTTTSGPRPRAGVAKTLRALLAHPNIASKRWIVRQYDHEVQGNTVLKPLVGPAGDGPGDASVIQPVPGSSRALAIGCGLAIGVGDRAVGGDAYLMALAAIDEAVRNLVCAGADPHRIAILDNFCWPSCKKPENLASLVRAAEGCYDGAKAYRTPFVSGKDSLNNQFTTEDGRTIEIPPTLLITGMGLVQDVARCVTSDAKRPGSALAVVGATSHELGGSHLQRLHSDIASPVPRTDLTLGPRLARAVAALIADGLVLSAHDVSDGGLLVAVAEMLIGACAEGDEGATLGAAIDLAPAPLAGGATADDLATAFSESPSRYILEIAPEHLEEVHRRLVGLPFGVLGRTNDSGRLEVKSAGVDLAVSDLRDDFTRPLDW
ncbi:MAG: phosphoribosylformylglycinamidine synthase, partial [Phycisphaerales bacterium]|nr:phosphoribosylformylglycinamidine synthase [Phycisphaerales bacterium]